AQSEDPVLVNHNAGSASYRLAIHSGHECQSILHFIQRGHQTAEGFRCAVRKERTFDNRSGEIGFLGRASPDFKIRARQRRFVHVFESSTQHVVQFGYGITAFFEQFKNWRVMQRSEIDLRGGATFAIELLDLVEVVGCERLIQTDPCGPADGRTHAREDHVSTTDLLLSSTDFWTRLPKDSRV